MTYPMAVVLALHEKWRAKSARRGVFRHFDNKKLFFGCNDAVGAARSVNEEWQQFKCQPGIPACAAVVSAGYFLSIRY
jgi:hypothetical protein